MGDAHNGRSCLRAVKAGWKVLVGGGCASVGAYELTELGLNATQVTVGSLLWVAVLVVGLSILGGAAD